MILADKYMDHLPLYRQKQRFDRENIHIASSTMRLDQTSAEKTQIILPAAQV